MSVIGQFHNKTENSPNPRPAQADAARSDPNLAAGGVCKWAAISGVIRDSFGWLRELAVPPGRACRYFLFPGRKTR
jgi:hypothetical protein